MIVYGTGSKDLGTRKIQGAKCPNCESNEIYVNAISRYADVFWIPIFPFSKKFFSVCQNCEQVLEKKEMPQQLKDKVDMEKHHFKTPFYLFSGLIIIALLIGYGIYASSQHDKEIEESVSNLQPKEVIMFKEGSAYSFAKVEAHSNDTIYIKYSNYTLSGHEPSRAEFIEESNKDDDFFNNDIYYHTQQQIDSLYSSGDIIEIFKF